MSNNTNNSTGGLWQEIGRLKNGPLFQISAIVALLLALLFWPQQAYQKKWILPDKFPGMFELEIQYREVEAMLNQFLPNQIRGNIESIISNDTILDTDKKKMIESSIQSQEGMRAWQKEFARVLTLEMEKRLREIRRQLAWWKQVRDAPADKNLTSLPVFPADSLLEEAGRFFSITMGVFPTRGAAPGEIRRLEKLEAESRRLFFLVTGLVHPRNFPRWVKNWKGPEEARPLFALMILGQGVNNIYDPFFPRSLDWQKYLNYSKGKPGKPTIRPVPPEISKKLAACPKAARPPRAPTEAGKPPGRFLISHSLPAGALRAWPQLCSWVKPLGTGEEAARAVEKQLTGAPLPKWIQREATFLAYRFLTRNEDLAESRTRYEEKRGTFQTLILGESFLVLLLTFGGFGLLLYFRFRIAPTLVSFPLVYAPDRVLGMANIGLTFVLHLFLSQLFPLVLTGFTGGEMTAGVVLLSYALTFGTISVWLFWPLLSGYQTTFYRFLVRTDYLLVNRRYGSFVKWSVGGFMAVSALILLLNQLVGWLGLSGGTPGNVLMVSRLLETPLDAFLLFLVLCVLAPFIEELIFRGYFLAAFRQGMNFWPAVLLNGLLFGLFHFEPSVIWELSLMGVILGYIRLRAGSLLVPMIIHGLWNFKTLALILTGQI